MTLTVEVVEVFSEVISASTPKHTKCQKFLRLKPNHVIEISCGTSCRLKW